MIVCLELSFRRKHEEKTADHNHKHQDKETDFKFKLKKFEMSHAEKMAANKSAAEKQQNDHSLSMAELKLREQELQMKNNAINHSSVKSQTIIPGQFYKTRRRLLNFGIVIMNGSGEKTLDKDTTQFLRTHLRYDQMQVTTSDAPVIAAINTDRTGEITKNII